MKLFIQLILSTFIFLFSVNNIYAAFSGSEDKNTEDIKTISESKEYINELKSEENQLKEKWEIFTKENGKITSFIKDSLSKVEIKKLERILENYYYDKNILDKDILLNEERSESIEKLRKELLKIKIKLYKEIVPYINKAKIPDYLEYIKSNIDIFEKNKILKDEIKKEEQMLSDKVSIIKDKIREHRKELNDNLRKIIVEKLNEKIKHIKENEKFILLETNKKIELFNLTLGELSKKKEELDNLESQTTIIKKKIEIYEIAIEIIEKVIDGLIEESNIQ